MIFGIGCTVFFALVAVHQTALAHKLRKRNVTLMSALLAFNSDVDRQFKAHEKALKVLEKLHEEALNMLEKALVPVLQAAAARGDFQQLHEIEAVIAAANVHARFLSGRMKHEEAPRSSADDRTSEITSRG